MKIFNFFTNPVKNLFGDVKKDFSPKILPGLVSQARRATGEGSDPTDRMPVSRGEFKKRYENLQLAIFLMSIMLAWCVYGCLAYDGWSRLNFFSGLILTGIFILQHCFRAWVARLVWRTWGARDGRTYTLIDYLGHLVTHPTDIFPVSLPPVDTTLPEQSE